jgi:hypothetical protein
VEAFIARYSRYLRGDEIFLPTKAPALPGTTVRFSLEIAGGEPVIQGKGTVTRVHGGHPNLVPGMDVAFEPLDERSRARVKRMQQLRRESLTGTGRANVAVSAKPTPPPTRPPPTPPPIPQSRPPTNPSCRISDGSIEYSIEWSVDQSTRDRPAGARSWPRVPTPYVAAALLFGVLIGWMVRPGSSKHKRPTLATATASPVLALAPTPHPPAVAHTEKPPAAPNVHAANDSATLAITSRPAGASITIDGKPTGVTPATIKVAPGAHEVSLTKPRYAPVSLQMTAPAKQDLILKRPSAKLIVSSKPAAGEVILKGKRCGKTPLQLDVDAFKSYDVQVEFANGKVWRQKIYIKAPSTEILASLSGVSLSAR